MRRDVRKQCRSCLTCAMRKGTGRPPLKPFHRIGVDVLLPLTKSGNQYIIGLPYKVGRGFCSAKSKVAQLLVEEIFCRYGAPQELLSDRGPNWS